MMNITELFYDSYSLALFAVSHEMGSRSAMDFLEKIHREEIGRAHV